jgi:hypothetical protein
VLVAHLASKGQIRGGSLVGPRFISIRWLIFDLANIPFTSFRLSEAENKRQAAD